MRNMTMAEAAELLCCSAEHVRKLIHLGELVAFNVAASESRRKLIVDGHSLESFMHRKRVEDKDAVEKRLKSNEHRQPWRYVQ